MPVHLPSISLESHKSETPYIEKGFVIHHRNVTCLYICILCCEAVKVYVDRYACELVGGASAASKATLSSCPLRFAVYSVGLVRAINP